jgi:hypothetical protein
VIRREDLTFSGKVDPIDRATRSGRTVEHSFCPECRAPLFSRAPTAPEYMSLRGGTLDDASWVIPIAQTFVESSIPWAMIPGVRAVSWDDFDFVALGQEWLATAPEFRGDGANGN